MTIYASNYPLPHKAPEQKPVPGWNPDLALAALERLKATLPGAIREVTRTWDQVCAVADREQVHQVLERLRQDPQTPLDMLSDVTCIDYLGYTQGQEPAHKSNQLPAAAPPPPPERFAVSYVLENVEAKVWLRLKAYLPESDPRVPTASDLWPAANWAEREASEMYGVVFEGHPDPRKLLLPDYYQGHPLRKDYPLRGRGERENFPKYMLSDTAGTGTPARLSDTAGTGVPARLKEQP